MSRKALLAAMFLGLVGLCVAAVLLSRPSGRPGAAGGGGAAVPDREEAAAGGGSDASPSEALPGEEGDIAGVVLDPDGKPRPGARVSLADPRLTTEDYVGRLMSETRAGAMEVRFSADGVPARRAGPHATTETDAGGRFRFAAPGEGEFSVEASARGFVRTEAVSAKAGRRDLVLRLRAGAILRGTVVDAAGTPVAFAGVTGGGLAETAAEDGTFELAGVTPGKVRVEASANGYESATAEADVTAGTTTDLPAPLVLAALSGLGGRALTPEGRPLAGVRALALRTLFDSESGLSDAGGRYWFRDREAGEWDVTLSHPEYLPAKFEKVPVVTGERRVLPDARLLPGGEIVGTMTGIGGRPVEGVVVAARPAGKAVEFGAAVFLGAFGGTLPTSGKDGAYRVAGLEAGEYTLTAVRNGYRPFRKEGVAVRVPEKTVVDVALDPGQSVSGRVLTAGGQAVPGAEVSVTDGLAPAPSRNIDEMMMWADLVASARTDAEGRFTITGIGEAPVSLRVTADGFGPEDVTGVLPGEAGVEVRLNPCGSVAGVVLDAASGAPVPDAHVYLEHGMSDGATSGPDGTFVLTGVAAGSQEVGARAAGYVSGTAPAEVKAGERTGGVVVRLRMGERLTVLVVRASDGSPIAKAAVEASGAESAHGVTDEAGRAELAGLAPGAVEVRVEAEGFARGAATGVTVPREEPCRVALGLGGAIRGLVLDEAGRPAPGRMVVLGAGGDFGEASAQTDANGRFALEHVGPGDYVVMLVNMDPAGGFSFGAQTRKVTVVEGEEVFVEFGGEKAPSARLLGRLLDGGAPVAGRMVVLLPADADGGLADLMAGMKMTTTDSEGRFDMQGLAPGRYVLLSGNIGGEEMGAGVPVEIDEAGEVRKDLELPAGKVAGKVTDAEDGTPVSGARLLLGDAAALRAPIGSLSALLAMLKGAAGSGSDGAYAIENASPGPAYLLVTAPGHAPRAVGPVDAGEAGKAVDVVLEKGSVVTFRVRGPDGTPVAGADLLLFDPQGLRVLNMDEMSESTDVEGKAELRLGRGRYRVLVQSLAFAAAEVEVSAPREGEVAVALAAGGTVRVVAASAAGPVAGARVRVFSDGREVTTHVTQATLTTGVPPSRTGADGALSVFRVPAGEVRVVAEAPDGRQGTARATLEEGGTVEVAVTLK